MILKPTSDLSQAENRFKIFLAGSIEMGKAENWQEKLEKELQSLGEICVLNPRRDDWDTGWKQEMTNVPFYEQVNWELNGLEAADLIVCYFSPETQSPVTMLELGLFARSGKLVVCCPDGFWRKGNIDIVCEKYAIPMVESVNDLVVYAAKTIKQKK
ncbi:nucleoside 2-deoxyribosyltransferase domain-containing protein [Fluviicola sp.]|uniref:nucleoside 2-deoxyribosyltransferase domain-containing protein n=1 Tax=Fluviicola sp. TaxID=1917219 RepID=UPI0031D68723